MLGYRILGTKHAYQRTSRNSDFAKYLLSIIAAKPVVLIAEELNVNLPTKQWKSVARDLAGERRIPWLPIDMTFDEQRTAGIYEALIREHEYRARNIYAYAVGAQSVRENHWLDCIDRDSKRLKLQDGFVLILCGRIHLPFLARKARRRGFVVHTDEYPVGLGKKLGKPILFYGL